MASYHPVYCTNTTGKTSRTQGECLGHKTLVKTSIAISSYEGASPAASPVLPQLLSVVLAERTRVAHECCGQKHVSDDARAPIGEKWLCFGVSKDQDGLEGSGGG